MNQSPSLGDSDSNSLAGNVPHEIRRMCCRIMLLFCCLPFCLFACFTRDVRKPLSQIRLSLSVSLGAGQIIFLAGIKATENTVSDVFIHLRYICSLAA